MLDFFARAIAAVSLLELALILVARIVEVSIGTLRVILMNKGYRIISSVLAFIEVLIWVIVASNVLNKIAENPIKVVVYSFGFAAGVYLGSIIEGKVALGNILIQAILPLEKGIEIASILREDGIGVTTLDAEGKDTKRLVLMIYSKRRGKEKVIDRIKELEPTALIVSNDLATIQGGYISPTRKFTK